MKRTVHSARLIVLRVAKILLLFYRSNRIKYKRPLIFTQVRKVREIRKILDIEEFHFPSLLTLTVRKQFLIRVFTPIRFERLWTGNNLQSFADIYVGNIYYDFKRLQNVSFQTEQKLFKQRNERLKFSAN